MEIKEKLKGMFQWGWRKIFNKGGELQPRDIFSALKEEMKKRKKFGIEDQAFVPNVFTVFLCPYDYEELSPLLAGIRDQLKVKLEGVIRQKGYRILSKEVIIEIRDDGGLHKNQIVVKPSFVKEQGSAGNDRDKGASLAEKRQAAYQRVDKQDTQLSQEPVQVKEVKELQSAPPLTRIVDEKKTTIMEGKRVTLQIIAGEGTGDVIVLKEGEHTFGRGRDATYQIKDVEETVSRIHFKIKIKDGQIRIEDLQSSNGTQVNQVDIDEVVLKGDDVISAGKVQLRVVK